MRLALYQPEIAQNTGTLLRTAACLGFDVDIIRPTGFAVSDSTLTRSGMDYIEHVTYRIHDDYASFQQSFCGARLVLLSTKASQPYWDMAYTSRDILMVGRESDGVPSGVEEGILNRVTIPMEPGLRSLNVAVAAAMVMGEMVRQLKTKGGQHAGDS